MSIADLRQRVGTVTAVILGVMLLIPGINVSVYAIPFWLAFIAICYWVRRSTGTRR